MSTTAANRKRKNDYLKDKSCVICGSKRNLEFDHINPKEKEYKISQLWGYSKERREKEIKKCQILCRSCHRKKTATEIHYTPSPHGAERRYKVHGCRCDVCRRGNAVRALNGSYYKKRHKIRPHTQTLVIKVDDGVED